MRGCRRRRASTSARAVRARRGRCTARRAQFRARGRDAPRARRPLRRRGDRAASRSPSRPLPVRELLRLLARVRHGRPGPALPAQVRGRCGAERLVPRARRAATDLTRRRRSKQRGGPSAVLSIVLSSGCGAPRGAFTSALSDAGRVAGGAPRARAIRGVGCCRPLDLCAVLDWGRPATLWQDSARKRRWIEPAADVAREILCAATPLWRAAPRARSVCDAVARRRALPRKRRTRSDPHRLTGNVPSFSTRPGQVRTADARTGRRARRALPRKRRRPPGATRAASGPGPASGSCPAFTEAGRERREGCAAGERH